MDNQKNPTQLEIKRLRTDDRHSLYIRASMFFIYYLN